MGFVFRRFSVLVLTLMLMMTTISFNVSADVGEGAGELSYTEVIAPQYDDARSFSEGLAAVKRGDKWGYINESGEVVIDFQYDRAHSFSEGKALIEKRVKEGDYIRRYYFMITPDNKSTQFMYGDRPYDYFDVEIYDTTFYNGYILLPAGTPNGTFVFDEYGQAFDDSAFLPTEGLLPKYNHYTTLDDEEYVILYDDLGFIGASPFNQGMAPVAFEELNDQEGYYYSFLKKDGTLWSGPKFYNYYVSDISRSYQVFNDHSLASLRNAEGKWGAVNKEGKTILPFEYEQLRTFHEGIAPFSQNGKFGFIDIHGNEVIQPQFDDTSGFHNGLAVVRQGNTAHLIDKQGNQVKGSENIPVDAYFKETGLDENGDVRYIITGPGEYIVIQEHNKFGIAKLDYTEKIISVTGVGLDHTAVELEEGEVSAPLVPTISPMNATNKNVTWSSSNEEVATVDAYGIVTAKSAGATTITVTTEDGAHTARSEVTVVEPDPYVDYEVWGDVLEHDSTSHSWTITFNKHVDESTVNAGSVYIIDKDRNKLGFIHSTTENSESSGKISLENKGDFKVDEDYWIIIEDTVQSVNGQSLNEGLKVPFTITSSTK